MHTTRSRRRKRSSRELVSRRQEWIGKKTEVKYDMLMDSLDETFEFKSLAPYLKGGHEVRGQKE